MSNYPPSEQSGYSPSPEQLEREKELERFNRWMIYLPVGLAAATALALLILMLTGIFAPGLVGAEAFLSGLADTILVLWMLPMSVLCAIGPIAYLAYLVNRRQRRSQLPSESPLLRHSRTQMALWQAQDISDSIAKKADALSNRVAQPLLSINAIAAYIHAWLALLARPFRRDEYDDRDAASGPDELA